jgi:hypothetical protein
VAFIWIIIQITKVIQIMQLLLTILHGSFFFDDLLRHGSRRRGCDGIPFIIVILSHAAGYILFGHLQDQLVTGLDHSFRVAFSFFSF